MAVIAVGTGLLGLPAEPEGVEGAAVAEGVGAELEHWVARFPSPELLAAL
jgi:hypothetical protein